MGYQMHPESLPEATQRAIFRFEEHAFPGLVLASCVEGSLTEAADKALPSQPTIQDIETFIPDPHQAIVISRVSRNYIVGHVLKSWRQTYASMITPSTTHPEWCLAGDAPSPFRAKEQKAMLEYVGGYIRKHLPLQHIVWNNYDREDTGSVFSYLYATLLGTVSDIAAMPRIMAGMDFDRERSALVAHIKQDYEIDQQGVIGVRNEMQPSARSLAESLAWKKPCEDISPTYGALGSLVGVYTMRQPLLQLIETLGLVAEVDPNRLLTPLNETSASEFRSPFRVNSYQLLRRALEVYSDDKKKVLDTFFKGEVIELPRGIYVDTALTAERREKLLGDHQAIMQTLREKELGQRMINWLATPRSDPLELKRGDHLDIDELSTFIALRLKNIARILYDLSPDSDIIAPSISLTNFASERIDGMLSARWSVDALHLAMYSKNKLREGANISEPFRIAAIVEESNDYGKPIFSGVYFTIAMSDKAKYGVCRVRVKTGGPRMSDGAAAKLMRPPTKL